MGEFDNWPEVKQNKKDAEALCKALGEGEVASATLAAFEIKLGENNLQIHVQTQDKKQWRASGCWPWDSRHRQHIPKDGGDYINVTKSRGIEALAADIKRKLLERYRQQHAEMVVQASAANNTTNQRLAIIKDLCEATGARATERTLDSGNIDGPARLNIYKMQVSEHGNVMIHTYDLHPDVAKLVIEALKKGAETHPG